MEDSKFVVYEQQNAIYNHYKTRYKITEEKYNELKAFKIEENDFIMSGAGTIGRISRVPKGIKPGVFNQALIRFRLDHKVIDSEYFIQFIRSEIMQKKLTSANPGSAITNLVPMSEVKQWNIITPLINEQAKIGNFFKQLDETINLHRDAIQRQQELKKGLLQKIFPTNGVLIPQVRFSNFEENWEQRKLGELFIKAGSGGTPKSTNKSYYNGDIPFLGISDISKSNGFIYNTEKYISEEGLKNSAAWIVPSGAVSLAMYASVGKIAILKIDVATSQAFYNMIFEYDSLRDYVYHVLSKVNEFGEWNKLISTGTQANLNADKVKNFEIDITTKKEEISKISTLFMEIDKLITLHQQSVLKYQAIKNSFLQKMFVS